MRTCETILGRFAVEQSLTSLALSLDSEARMEHERGETERYHLRRLLLHDLLSRHAVPAIDESASLPPTTGVER